MSGLMHWPVSNIWHAVIVCGVALFVALAGAAILATLANKRDFERGTSAFDQHADDMLAMVADDEDRPDVEVLDSGPGWARLKFNRPLRPMPGPAPLPFNAEAYIASLLRDRLGDDIPVFAAAIARGMAEDPALEYELFDLLHDAREEER